MLKPSLWSRPKQKTVIGGVVWWSYHLQVDTYIKTTHSLHSDWPFKTNCHAKTCLLTLLLNIHRWFNVASMILWKLSTHTHCGYNPFKFYIMLKEKPLSASSDDPLQLKRLTTLKEMNLLNIWKYLVRVDPIWYPPPYPATMRICYVHLCSNCCVFMVFQEEKVRRENEESQSRFSGLFCMLFGPGDIQSACCVWVHLWLRLGGCKTCLGCCGK